MELSEIDRCVIKTHDCVHKETCLSSMGLPWRPMYVAYEQLGNQ